MGIQSRVGQEAAGAPPAGGRSAAATAAMLVTVAADGQAAQTVHLSKEMLENTVVGRDDDSDEA